MSEQKRYIGYYSEYDSNGEVIDNFSDWCFATSYEKAKELLLLEYLDNDRVFLDDIYEDNGNDDI